MRSHQQRLGSTACRPLALEGIPFHPTGEATLNRIEWRIKQFLPLPMIHPATSSTECVTVCRYEPSKINFIRPEPVCDLSYDEHFFGDNNIITRVHKPTGSKEQ